MRRLGAVLPEGVRAAGDREVLATAALLFVGSAAGTVSWCASMSGGMPMPGGWTMSMAWMRMPGQTWPGAAASFTAMWTVMMVAMMLPSLVPALSSYRRSVGGNGGGRLGRLTALVGAGYFFVWGLVGAAAYPLGVGLAAAEMRWPAVARHVPAATGLLVLLAGAVQLGGWKARQLAACRDAPGCVQAPRRDARSAWGHGCRLGVRCALCCAGFTTVLLVTGVMDLRAMVLLTAAITLERLTPWPERARRVSGVVLVVVGALATVRGLA